MGQRRRVDREEIKRQWKEHNKRTPDGEKCSYTEYWRLCQNKERGEK